MTSLGTRRMSTHTRKAGRDSVHDETAGEAFNHYLARSPAAQSEERDVERVPHLGAGALRCARDSHTVEAGGVSRALSLSCYIHAGRMSTHVTVLPL